MVKTPCTYLLSQKFKNVTAINFNKKQLAIAKNNIKQKKITNIKLTEADIMQTSFENEFDFVLMKGVLEHMSDIDKTIKELNHNPITIKEGLQEILK